MNNIEQSCKVVVICIQQVPGSLFVGKHRGWKAIAHIACMSEPTTYDPSLRVGACVRLQKPSSTACKKAVVDSLQKQSSTVRL